jgi:hypothetical protein
MTDAKKYPDEPVYTDTEGRVLVGAEHPRTVPERSANPPMEPPAAVDAEAGPTRDEEDAAIAEAEGAKAPETKPRTTRSSTSTRSAGSSSSKS